MFRYIAAGLALFGLLVATEASAQAPATVKLCVQSGTTCVPVSVGNPLPVTGGGGGGGLSVVDQTAWTQGTSPFTPTGGVFNDTATLSSGQEGTVRLTSDRQMKVLDSTVLGTINGVAQTTAHGCSVAGYGVLGCLGQIDDDVKGPIPSQSPAVPIGGVSLCDGANGATNPCTTAATVKAASTAAAAADKGLVVSLSPNNAAIGAFNVTPTDCSGTITSGGAAQNAIVAQTTLHGFTIANIDTGHNAEVLWISFTTTAAASTAASYPLPAPTATTFAGFGSFTTPPGFGTNHAVSIIGATTGHIFSCSWW